MFGQNSNFYHHTLLLRSLQDVDTIKQNVAEIVELAQITFTIMDEDKLTIDHVREIQEMTYRKNPTEYTIYIIRVAGMSHEAQNGLLKIIEEPPVGTIFIFATTEPTLLPTFLSRSHEVVVDEKQAEGFDPQEFYTKKIPDRLEEVTEMIALHKKGKITRQQIMKHLGSLSEFLLKEGKKDDAERVFQMTQTLTISSGSLKQVLEGVSVMV